jgi:hypothetical protein
MSRPHIEPARLAAVAEGRRELLEPGDWRHLATCQACRDALDEATVFRFEWLQDEERFAADPGLVGAIRAATSETDLGRRSGRPARDRVGSWRLAVPALAAVLALVVLVVGRDDHGGQEPRGLELSGHVEQIRHALKLTADHAMVLPDLPLPRSAGPVYRDRAGDDLAGVSAAVRALGEAYGNERGDPGIAFWLVAGHLARDELVAADFYVQDALRYHPRDNRLTALAGVVAYRNNRLAQADSLFRAALDRDDDLERVRYNLGVLLLEMGHTGEGRRILEHLRERSEDPRLAERAAALLGD